MPLQATSGAASYDGFGGGPAAVPNYIEECFATHLYTGNGSTQTITNGIDLSTKGGMVWLKSRISSVYDHQLVDTTRGSTKYINSNLTNAESTSTNRVTAFNTNGFTLAGGSQVNESTGSYASWTFREQPKFFDVVTWTGDGTGNRTISHSLGSVPGCIIVKRTDTTSIWTVFHRSINSGRYGFIRLDSQNAANTSTDFDWNPTSTTFQADNDLELNFNNGTYVAYLFAHDAGGFGLTGTDNVISCGSFTTDGSANATVNLGYEPQWLLLKKSSSASSWIMVDNMRGWPVGTGDAFLYADQSSAESNITFADYLSPTATGFQANALDPGAGTYIYIAIRRGPMKTPTTGTSVFDDLSRTGTGTVGSETVVGFPVDMVLNKRSSEGGTWVQLDRLRGNPRVLFPSSTDAEFNLVDAGLPSTNGFTGPNQNSYYWPAGGSNYNGSGSSYASYFFRRAPGFFDVVCYTGTGSYPFTINHNLGVVPEMMIFKKRIYDAEQENWYVYQNSITSPNSNWYQNILILNSTTSSGGASSFITTAPTSTAITAAGSLAESGDPWVVYLFASCPGVSKVFSFTGNGSSQTINCGFTGGSRLVLIKRTDSTGNWVIFDSARGIVAGNDPALYLNSTAAEVTGVDAVDTDSTGFIVNQETTFNLNVNNATYIGLAIS